MSDTAQNTPTETKSERTGACLCGGVSFTAPAASSHIGACHCATCRKWSGGPFMEINCGDAVSFEGAENITVYDSSEWAERAFCKKCGSHLYYRLKPTGEHLMLVGLFDDDSGLSFASQVFIDAKPDYYSFANETHNMTGEELFAAAGAES